MTHNIDWSKAPEDATHCIILNDRVLWRKVVADGAYHWVEEHKRWSDIHCPDLEKYIARPVEPAPRPQLPTNTQIPEGATRVALVWGREDRDKVEIINPRSMSTGCATWEPLTSTMAVNYMQDSIALVSEREEQPVEWDGNGNPPVGAICMCQFANAWRKVKIVGHVPGYYWVEGIDEHGMSTIRDARRFTPYLTDEQRAAKKRREDIADICNEIEAALHPYNTNIDCTVAIRATIETLYDKGYFEGDRE